MPDAAFFWFLGSVWWAINFVFHRWQLLLVSLAGWLNREQQAVVGDLRTENQILKEVRGKKRILLKVRTELRAPTPPITESERNAHIERFIRSIKEECLDRMIFFGERSLRNAVREFLSHYHRERNHQGLSNQIIVSGRELGQAGREVYCRERLGGMLRYYYRDAA
jgi:hypothetical protein